MDFVAHLLWSGILFAGNQGWWAVFFGGLPDLIPFGLNMIVSPLRRRKKRKQLQQCRSNGNTREQRVNDMMAYYKQPENRWVYTLYNYTHSLVVWAVFFSIFVVLGNQRGYFPYFAFAWLLHIIIDIPTHEKRFFAPQFLTPVSTFCVDGKSWANRKFMLLNYGLITIGIFVQLALRGLI